MSDTSQGPGWWQASDGKWYAPELYPKDWDATVADATAPASAGDTPTETIETVETIETDPEPAGVEVDAATGQVVNDEPSDSTTVLGGVTDAAAPVAEELGDAAPQVELGGTPASPWSTPAAADAAPAAIESAPPSGWSSPDPAAGEPTIARGIPAVQPPDPTTVQPAVAAPPPAPPAAPAPAGWEAPSAPPAVTPPSPDVRSAAQSMRAATGPDVAGGGLGIIGGLIAIVGSFLVWAEASGSVSGEVNGLTGSNGWGTLIAGLAIAALGAALIAGIRQSWVGGLMIAGGIAALGLAIYSIIDIGNTSDDLPAAVLAQGYPADVANTASLDPSVGVWLPLVGGAIGVVGGVAALLRRS